MQRVLDSQSEGSVSMEVRKKDSCIQPHSFVLCDRATGIARYRVEADPDGSLPAEKIASLLAIHCLVRDQQPEDFELMVLPKESLLESVGERVKQLLIAGRAIGSGTRISPREQEVLTGVVQNLANKEIAAKLNVSERTIKFHVSSLLAKFGVSNRVELGREAIFGRISDRNAGGEAPEQTLFGFRVQTPAARAANPNRPNQQTHTRANSRPPVRSLVGVSRERVAS
jgi:DNA-binding CsgD family transcriptional regulator